MQTSKQTVQKLRKFQSQNIVELRGGGAGEVQGAVIEEEWANPIQFLFFYIVCETVWPKSIFIGIT